MMRRALAASLCLLASAAGLLACGGGSNTPTPSGNGDPERGRRVYMATCIACHNVDPSRDGAIGPAIKGASRELLEARILNASYPPGYTPKRKTALMPKQPQLAKDIPDLAAYLSP
ncbi:MAG TPA: cytochrome c [Candidatus Eisenbacteria bacterium]|nr:cytochrome c [Candidatus Eisenbacteria bacterium]